jgi:hypothetical protein
MKWLWIALLMLPVAKPAVAQQAADNQATLYKPSATTVAVLPSINISEDKWKDLKAKEAEHARQTTADLFSIRGFQIVPPEQVDQAVTKLNLDLTNEDQWTKSNFYKVGKEVNADLVAFVLIKQTRQKTVGGIFLQQYQGEAELDVWLVDAKQEKPILNDDPARGKATGGVRATASRRLAAIKFAVEKAFDNVLKPYPKLEAPGKKGASK